MALFSGDLFPGDLFSGEVSYFKFDLSSFLLLETEEYDDVPYFNGLNGLILFETLLVYLECVLDAAGVGIFNAPLEGDEESLLTFNLLEVGLP